MWLVLTRKRDEDILIGEDILIKVFGFTKFGDEGALKVRLGISAPRHIKIARVELMERETDE
jgi:carbon storage regulator CsrA